MKIAVVVAATALTLALAMGWIRPDAAAAPFIAAGFLLARLMVALLGTRRSDLRRQRAGTSTREGDDPADEVVR